MEKIVTKPRRLFIPDSKVAEARRDLEMLLSPVHLITFNDGYYSRSLEQKWGMSIDDLTELLGHPVTKIVWKK